jgi:tRNA threonylcarbamoyladenosine biosynthesis protein TsaE
VPVLERITRSSEETTELGRQLASRLTAPVLVLLSGDLGSGKTTLTKGIVSGLGAAREEDVTSPTFTLVHVFQNRSAIQPPISQVDDQAERQATGQPKIYHVDLYRIEDFHGLESLALEDALADPAIVIIEWSERFSLRSDWPRIRVHLEHIDGDSRRIIITES